MKTFNFIADHLEKVWRRDYVSVTAETLEEAIKLTEQGEYDDVLDSEYLNDTEEYLKPEDNNGFMTCEIMDRSSKTLYSNGD